MAGTYDLPVELLACIFEHLFSSLQTYGRVGLFEMSVDLEDGTKTPTPVSTVWADRNSRDPSENLREPALFPCALARVCQMWKNILKQYPKYWTRFAFDLSADEPLLLDAFCWAKDLSYDVLIFDSRHSQPSSQSQSSISQAKEVARVAEITNALLPHFNRCLSLKYDVTFSTSLPTLPSLLQHSCDHITQLKLEYRASSLTHTDQHVKRFDPVTIPGACKSLTRLFIDVEMFMDMARFDGLWWSNFRPSSGCFTLKLSNYEFTMHAEDDELYSITEFLEKLYHIKHLQCLYLSNLTLKRSISATKGTTSRQPSPTRPHDLMLEKLKCDNLSRSFLRIFFRIFEGWVESGTFKSCKLPANMLFDSAYLQLEDCPFDSQTRGLLQRWSGFDLSVVACPCFDDTFLNFLADAGESGEGFPSPCLRDLSFHDCEAFTVEALKKLVEARQRIQGQDEDEDEEDGGEEEGDIRSLHLHGKGPNLTEEDDQWFRDHVSNLGFPRPRFH